MATTETTNGARLEHPTGGSTDIPLEKAKEHVESLKTLVPELNARGASTLLVEYMGVRLGNREELEAQPDTYQEPILQAWLPEAPESAVVGIVVEPGSFWWGEMRRHSTDDPEGAAFAVFRRLLELKPVKP